MRWLLILLISASLSGCAGDAPEQTDEVPNDVETHTPGGNQTVDQIVNNTAPTAAVGVDGFELFNGTLNLTEVTQVNFTLDGGDADGDNLTWTFAVNGTAVASGTELPAAANYTFNATGLWNVTLDVFDGNDTASDFLLVNVTLMEGSGAFKPTSAAADDGGSDGGEFTEITSITATNDGNHVIVIMTLDAVWPSTDVLSAATYSVNINGHLYNSFVRYAIDSNPMTWDNSAGGYMAAGTSSWTDTTVTFKIPIANLEDKGILGGHEIHGTANYGALNTREVQDRVPDAGKLPLV